jgi:hypothetical protein
MNSNTKVLIFAAALVAFAGPANAAAQGGNPIADTDAYRADNDARKAADRECPNDGEHNLVRDANDETKWVCIRDK